MRFAPGLDLAAASRLQSASAGGPSIPPADNKTVPQGLLPAAQADLSDQTNWTLDGDWTDTGGAAQKTGGATQQFVTSQTISIPAGDMWVSYTIKDATAGFAGVQLIGTFQNTRFQNRVTAQHVARFTSTGHTKVRALGTAPFDGTLDDLQVVDMSAILAQPADIYIAAGQSLMASESTSTPVDPDKDFWLPRCLYVPGSTNNTFGVTEGTRAACVAPLQFHNTSQGVSPITTFARFIEPATPAGRSILILACAQGGSRLVGPEAEWNPDGNTGNGVSLYNNMISKVTDALALNPGNQVKGLIWAQGESDRSATMDVSYPPAFANMLSRLRTDVSEPSLPAVIIGPMSDDTNGNQPLFLDMQSKLDQDSGDATSIAGVHYVARPAGHLSGDGTHPVPEGQRIAGRLAGQRFLSEGYL
ncbi:sialate O-acetylesterase [Halovulum sp. GXIMD14793]